MKTRKLIKAEYLKQINIPIFILIVIISLAMMPALPAAPAMAVVPPPFSGNVEADFNPADLGVVVINDPGGNDTPMPAWTPPGAISGMDMKDIRFYYDSCDDILYVGINTYTIAGDVEDNGDPSNPSAALVTAGGTDNPDFGGGEAFTVSFDIDEDGVWDVIAGVGFGVDTSGFSVSTYDSILPITPITAAHLAFETPLPSNTGALYGSPDAAHPDLEFTITNFSTLPSYGTDTLPTFTIDVRLGSDEDDNIGEDYVPGQLAPELDFGDAPDPAYPTLFASNGARHYVDPAVYLGGGVDFDADGQPNANANGDDLDGNDDEDGVIFTTPIRPGQMANVTVTASVMGVLHAWIDFTGDGDWGDPNEKIFHNVFIGSGPNLLSFSVPAGAVPGTTYARFRFISYDAYETCPGFGIANPLSYDDWAPDGEVEDYLVEIEQPLDYGDAPNSWYGTLYASDGARHAIVTGIHLGATVDAEADGQPSLGADGDDNNGDDEDGVTLGVLTPGDPAASVTVNGGPNGGQLDAWIDFNINGSFGGGEKIFNNLAISSGDNYLNFEVPDTAKSGTTYARFRLSINGGLSPTGFATDGEVEDYLVVTDNLDFGDAPNTYGTVLASDGARHVLDGVHWMGSTVDKEPDGQPNSAASGDDLNNDDEDGVTFTTLLQPDQTASVTVDASAAGALDAWIDFNGNGSFTTSEQIFTMEPLSAGSNNLNFNVPAGAATGTTYARFRMSVNGGLSPTGWASDGEVEDYQVAIEEPPKASIGDYVWHDANEDGCQDVDEDGINGVTVRLYTSGNILEATTTTAGGGFYLFSDVAPGSYYIKFSKPVGYIFTEPDQCGDDTDSDADPGTGKTIVTTLSSGENDMSWDAGLYKPPPPPCLVGGEVAQEGVQDILMLWIVVIAVLLMIGVGGAIIVKRRGILR
jgi:hypothetical protein